MRKIVIIGNSASGISAAKSIRQKDSSSQISIISQEKYLSYLKPCLFDYLSGKIKRDKLFYVNDDFYTKNNIELIAKKEVIRINEKRKVIFLDDKTNLNYDVLLLASGAVTHVPEIKGAQKCGVFHIRSLEDIDKILEILPVISDVCIIGAGSIGLSAAVSFKARKLDVTVITKSKCVLASYLDYAASLMIQKRLEDYGINFILDQNVTEIIGEGEVRAIKLESGKIIASSLVLIAKGSLPNLSFINDTEIKIDKGIVVDSNFKTNIPDVYAAGEVCQCYNVALDKSDINRTWQTAIMQGEIAGRNMVEENINYEGFLNFKMLNFMGLEVLSVGQVNCAETIEEKIFFDEPNDIYKKLFIKDNKIIGTILIGDLSQKERVIEDIKNKKDMTGIKDKLFD